MNIQNEALEKAAALTSDGGAAATARMGAHGRAATTGWQDGSSGIVGGTHVLADGPDVIVGGANDKDAARRGRRLLLLLFRLGVIRGLHAAQHRPQWIPGDRGEGGGEGVCLNQPVGRANACPTGTAQALRSCNA